MRQISLSDSELESLDLGAMAPEEIGLGPGDRSLEKAFDLGAGFMRETVRSRFSIPSGGRVLDLLGGFGRWSIFLGEVSSEVVVLDRLPGFISLGKRLVDDCGLNNVSFLEGEVERIRKLKKNSFDVIWLWSALQYVNRGAVLKECRRLLRPGGLLAVGAYNSVGVMLEHVENGIESGQLFEGASAWALGGLAAGPQGDGTPNFTTLDDCGRMLSEKGLELMGIAPANQLNLGDSEVEAKPVPEVRGFPRTVEFVAKRV